jgi:hypothetical protein
VSALSAFSDLAEQRPIISWDSCIICGDKAPIFTGGHGLQVGGDGPYCKACHARVKTIWRDALGGPTSSPGEEPAAPTSWRPIDLTAVLDGDDLPPPEIFARVDGHCLYYRGRTHGASGESETLKSLSLQAAAAQVLAAGGAVLWIDYEDDERSVIGRLRAMSVDRAAILERFVYVRPDEPLADRNGKATAGAADFAQLLEHNFDLAVIDGTTEAMTTEGLDLLDNGDIAMWSRRLPKRLAAQGAAVVVIDHVPKNRENHGRFAIGGQHKLAGITGAAYRYDLVKPLARSVDQPITGIVTITVTKDRVGHVRSHADEYGRIAVMEITSWPDAGLTVTLAAPGSDSAVDLRLCRRIAEHIAIYAGASKSDVEASISGRAGPIREALAHMVTTGWLTVEKVGAAHRHHLTDTGRDELLEATDD